VVDLDATLVAAHSEKEQAAPTFKRGFGFHPMLAFVDHGDGGTGEPLAGLLRPGNANANNAADQIAVLDAALGQLPERARSRVLVRGDAGSLAESYADTPVGEIRDAWARGEFKVTGDADKMVDAMIAAADSTTPPLRLTLGSIAYGSIHKALNDRLAVLEASKTISLSTDVDR
jgi:hypothetical protein